ncbi:cytochrome c oxidase subunit II [Halorussus halophilus]|uniref:cytochrome c oxidase subunit II n=1 Tax=Halorussus halophilus TaxID=2650975 RepID=UPI001301018E|nr:cytochrome c oxidase subunit II [Halorussus halophilus]
MLSPVGARLLTVTLAQTQDGVVPKGTRVEVFRQIFSVFLLLGTLVGVVVVGYMLYNAYKYRDREGRSDDGDHPRLGELPSGGGGGRKLFFSFGLSTIIVVSLIAWTYGTLLYVEEDPVAQGEDTIEIDVVGYRFGWEFVYPNGNTTNGELRVPRGTTINLTVTSDDVFHTFGVPELRVKTDAIPGLETETWFRADETGTYEARCFELCGSGHSFMTADVIVMEPEAYEEWYANTSNSTTTTASPTTNNSSSLPVSEVVA